MGNCCFAEIKKPEVFEMPLEEETIQSAESKLAFSHQTLNDLLFSIDRIDFSLDINHLDCLCDTLITSYPGPTARFLHRLASQSYLILQVLKMIAILLCKPGGFISKSSILYSNKRETYLTNIKYLYEIAICIIPQNLEVHDISVSKYIEKMKRVSENHLKQYDNLTVQEIKYKMDTMEISSKDIRLCLYRESMRHKDFYKEKDFRHISKSIYTANKRPVVDIETFIKEPLIDEKCASPINTESPEKKTIWDKQSQAVYFDKPIVAYSRRLSDTDNNLNISGRHTYINSLKDEQNSEFLEKIKGIKGYAIRVDIEKNCKSINKGSHTELSKRDPEEIAEKKINEKNRLVKL